MERSQRALKILVSYPLTWGAFLIVILMEGGLILWFSPPLLMTLILVGIGIVMLIAWPSLFLKSDVFRQLYNKMPYETEADDLEKVFKSCPEPFKITALACLRLVRDIRKEFQSHQYENELDVVLQRLTDLGQNHQQLHSRLEQFGTAQQKKTMQALSQQQVMSVEKSLKALRTFSGHLTLLEAHPEEAQGMSNELKAINQGLQEAIQEVQDE